VVAEAGNTERVIFAKVTTVTLQNSMDNPIQKRLALFDTLSRLPAPQFEQVVFGLNPPPGNVPPASAAQGQRLAALLQWAESPMGCGLDTVEQVLNAILPSFVPSSDLSPPVAAVPPPAASSASTQSTSQPLEVFISYSHQDEDLTDELYVHLSTLIRQKKIQPWQDRAIEAGQEWDEAIKARLESADIILLLVTPQFIASDYCFDQEMQRAMERHGNRAARVIPIIMKPCDWRDTPFSKLYVLPKDGIPVTTWDDRDSALLNVVQGIRRVVESLSKK
jgi:hypothetical protein